MGHYFTIDISESFDDIIINSTCTDNISIYNSNGSPTTIQRCYPLLINFAHKCCQRSQQRNCNTGLINGIRQCIKMNMSIFDNDQQFMKRNKHILNQTRGAGYWLWKPYIILKELYLAREGDIIIYSDATVNFIRNIQPLIDLTKYQDVITFKHTSKEYIWTKRDAFITMNVDEPLYYNSSAGIASYVILRKSLMSMTFVSEWLTYAQDNRIITDDKNVFNQKNYDGFRENRHDQSILSLLAKKWNLTIYPDPSQRGNRQKRPYSTFFYHHRIRD
ncbi:unnamed protein product [Adineta steineri]|uniref:Nucleotide-diphospho-sugar transferase domain-containing protein n=1 Tax=Adineta steineri TaxID=433720 RepID=A0A814AZK0_9BILA|nr:unnamed protein product [Adineta steineri]CAF0919849.1 unnamed protein product [Adineta steineri]